MNDVVVQGGYIANFVQTDTLGEIYDAILIPNSGEGLKSVRVESNVFQDSAGVFNEMSNTFEWTYDVSNPSVGVPSQVLSFQSRLDCILHFQRERRGFRRR